jgi:hypothetical protein
MFQFTIALVVSLLCSGVVSAQELAARAPAAARRITLQQGQQLAAAANNPMVRLGELQVEAAEQHRLGVKSMYFPNVSTQLENLHFNTPPGEVLTVPRPFRGTTLSVPVNIIEQDQTAVNVSVVQPITPIFAVRPSVARPIFQPIERQGARRTATGDRVPQPPAWRPPPQPNPKAS